MKKTYVLFSRLDTGGMSPMPTGGYAHNFFQLDHDRVLRIGGRNNQAPITNAHVYYRSNTCKTKKSK